MARVVKATTGCVTKAAYDQSTKKLDGGLVALETLRTTVVEVERVTSEQEVRLAQLVGDGSQSLSLQDMSAECIRKLEDLNAQSTQKLQAAIEIVDKTQTERVEEAVNDLHHFHAEFAQLKVG